MLMLSPETILVEALRFSHALLKLLCATPKHDDLQTAVVSLSALRQRPHKLPFKEYHMLCKLSLANWYICRGQSANSDLAVPMGKLFDGI